VAIKRGQTPFLRVIFLDKDRRRFPNLAMADVVDDAADGEIVVRLFASAVGGPPVWSSMIHRMLKPGTCPASRSFLKSCHPKVKRETGRECSDRIAGSS